MCSSDLGKAHNQGYQDWILHGIDEKMGIESQNWHDNCKILLFNFFKKKRNYILLLYGT